MNNKRTQSTKSSKNACVMGENQAKRCKLPEIDQQDQPSSLTSQDSDETLTYSLGASSYPDYNRNDFESDDEGSDHSDTGRLHAMAGASTVTISDNSSDDEKLVNKPWQQDNEEPNKGKYRMRQSTLNFSKAVKTQSKQFKPENSKITRSLFKYSDIDTAEYRNGYPGKKDDPSLKENLLFYKGDIQSAPDGDYIYDIHQNWFADYKRLERHHGYIQWLFPIREDGMNWQAQALQLHEAKAIRASKEMRLRVLTSYRLMLDFYGMQLVDDGTGEIKRSPRWKDRFNNLQWSSHNYLRITRILKSLGELGYEHLKKPFIEFVLHEALVERTLERLLRSCEDYWIGTIKDDNDRQSLHELAMRK